MKHIAQFDYPKECKMIVRDSYLENFYYGLDEFDCRYIRILQAKFGCVNSFHTIPDRVKMEMVPFLWNEQRQLFVYDERKSEIVQLNRLEYMVISYSPVFSDKQIISGN